MEKQEAESENWHFALARSKVEEHGRLQAAQNCRGANSYTMPTSYCFAMQALANTTWACAKMRVEARRGAGPQSFCRGVLSVGPRQYLDTF